MSGNGYIQHTVVHRMVLVSPCLASSSMQQACAPGEVLDQQCCCVRVLSPRAMALAIVHVRTDRLHRQRRTDYIQSGACIRCRLQAEQRWHEQ